MDERDKIIREDYPVERLPEDLRLDDFARVRVTVEAVQKVSPEERRRRWLEIKALIDRARSHPSFRPVTTDEAVARVRALRDGWDD